MARLSVPAVGILSSDLRVASTTPAVLKSLSRLSRDGLIDLALDWLDDRALPNAFPFLKPVASEDEDEDDDDDLDDLYPPYRSVADLRQLYTNLQEQKGSKRDIISRIIEGDWRHGLSLYQLAMVDFAYLDEHDTSQTWTAYQILPLRKPSKDTNDEVLKVDKKSLKIPRFHPSTFLQNLQAQVLPDVKAHYHFHRHKNCPVLLLRIFVIESPYNTGLALSSLDASGTAANFDSSRTVYLAFPDGSPSLYVTKSQTTGAIAPGESKSFNNLIVDGVPKALSRPRERFTLKNSGLSSKNLKALLDKKGPGRGNAAGGGWSIYADEKNKQSPLDTVLPTPPASRDSEQDTRGAKRAAPLTASEQFAKRAKLVAEARFGLSGIVDDGKGIEKLEVVIEDPFPGSHIPDDDDDDDEGAEATRRKSVPGRRRSQLQGPAPDEDTEMRDATGWTPWVQVKFSGPHVFGGIRQLVEAGIIDGERMPGWMTGEEGVTTGIVRDGRIKGNKGSGL